MAGSDGGPIVTPLDAVSTAAEDWAPSHGADAARTPLRRLRALVAGWSEGDWLADPVFRGVAAELGSDPAVALARAWLSRHVARGWPAPALPAVVTGARAVLRRLLDATAGPASLRLHVDPAAAVVPGPPSRWADPEIGLCAPWPKGGLRWMDRGDAPLLVGAGTEPLQVDAPAAWRLHLHVPDPVPVDDDAAFLAAVAALSDGGPISGHASAFVELVETHARRNFGGLAWLTHSRAAVQAFGDEAGIDMDAALARYAASGDAAEAVAGAAPTGGALESVVGEPLTVADAVWPEADRLAAQLRGALGQALGADRVVAAPAQGLLVGLRAGLDALITVTTAGASDPRMGFVVGVDADSRQIGLRPDDDQPGLLHAGALPLGAVLCGDGYAAHVRFVANPFS